MKILPMNGGTPVYNTPVGGLQLAPKPAPAAWMQPSRRVPS